MSHEAIIRRQSIRAMRQLIARFGYPRDSFEIPTTRDNCLDALPGTPVYWTPPSYYEGESDCRVAVTEYRMMVIESGIDWSAVARWDYIRDKYARIAS